MTDEEVDFVIECGLVYMFENDLLPFKDIRNDAASFQPFMSEKLQ